MKTKKKYILILAFMVGVFTLLNCSSDNDRTPSLDSQLPGEPKEESNQAPVSFGLISVPNGANEVDVKPEFLWNAATDPDGDSVSYELFIDTNTNPTTSIQTNIDGTSFTLEDRLPLNENLFWKVIATDTEGNSTSSDTFGFTTRNLSAAPTAVTDNAPFSKRRDHTSVVFNDKMWVIGGFDGASTLNDIWQSTDGETWTQVTAEAPFHKRRFHTSLVFDNKIWVIGGYNGADFLTDIWQSGDGKNWTLVNGALPFTLSLDQTVIAFQDKLWFIGSLSGPAKSMATIWQSTDGETWTSVDTEMPFSDRYGFSTLVFDDKIWIIGGGSENLLNDSWQSSDGKTWNRVNTDIPFSNRKDHKTLVFDNKIWLIGGYDGASRVNDVWRSADGETWTQVLKEAPFTGKLAYTSIALKEKIWIIGGSTGTALLNDVWAMD